MVALRHVVIIANQYKPESLELSAEIANYLRSRSIAVASLTTKETNEKLAIPSDADLAISLGGDGTALFVARCVHDLGIPIMPVNMGTFGYIAEVSKSEWKETLDACIEGRAQLSRRTMIRVDVLREHKKVYSCHGLNEMVVTSAGISKVVNLEIRLDGVSAGAFRADGMIVATPTGSTGYSLAAGGPIVNPGIDALILTPVCPFFLSNRPLVVGGETEVEIHVRKGQRTGLLLTVDGQQNFPLLEDDVVQVEKARSKALIVKSFHRNSVDILREKLGWSRGGVNHA